MTLLRMGTILHLESSSFLLFKMSSQALAFPLFMSTDVCNYNVSKVRFVSGVWCQGHCIINMAWQIVSQLTKLRFCWLDMGSHKRPDSTPTIDYLLVSVIC